MQDTLTKYGIQDLRVSKTEERADEDYGRFTATCVSCKVGGKPASLRTKVDGGVACKIDGKLSFDSGFDLAAYRNLRAALAELHIVRL